MSDDITSKWQGEVKQGKHALKISQERAVQEVTGLSRSELRSLEKFQTRVQSIQTERSKQNASVVPLPPPLIKTTERNFYPKKIDAGTRVVDSAAAENKDAPDPTRLLPDDPTIDGDYVLRITIAGGVRTDLAWEIIGAC